MAYKGISDFRSDTVTRPTQEMRKAMAEAEVGDDVHNDDPTVHFLQEKAAEILGKPSALFVPSGTMGNTIAMILAVGSGNTVLLEEMCHIMCFEAGNVSRIAGSLPRPIPSDHGEIDVNLLKESIPTSLRDHVPAVKAIALENTHNFWGGRTLSLPYIKKVSALAKQNHLHMHLDGARIFNAAVALQKDVISLVDPFDTVMCCLSKGLSAPVGSVLAGSEEFIQEARKVRKYLGGGMRQVGILAAAGILALTQMPQRLHLDHQRARKLASNLAENPGIEINLDHVETNFVMAKLTRMKADEFLKKLANKSVLALPMREDLIRIVVHKDIDDADIDKASLAVKEIMN